MAGGPSDLGYDLLPPDSGTISPDIALDAALSPVVDYSTPSIEPFGKGWQFDFVAGQFVRSGASAAEAYDLANLRVWIEKTLRTAKFAHPIYSDSYGMEDPFLLIGYPSQSELIGDYQQQIVEALLVHDRIIGVQDFAYQQQALDDALYVSFSVVLDGNPQQEIQVSSLPLAPS
jgi:hypothetical protein